MADHKAYRHWKISLSSACVISALSPPTHTPALFRSSSLPDVHLGLQPHHFHVFWLAVSLHVCTRDSNSLPSALPSTPLPQSRHKLLAPNDGPRHSFECGPTALSALQKGEAFRLEPSVKSLFLRGLLTFGLLLRFELLEECEVPWAERVSELDMADVHVD
ncbi:hypothetical protein P153DRAFT_381289 [Dothidotthia symphoricarpi CBS 119687]|uniref:Uncharacterized protein n=1 Tax=Dothidotthia symphoricarpi CBS 119687 TaxID=1392245 RepID=A0A6A6AQ33_9PLEO|nr:uncharacterized protein P153DRAFT_381289 [Dothidotthia symphoricarpi CBS 119687]KAF2134112.1 hypothetical protein P153DRAFT_381289 [Dothidotthia symphoricarpi CBS 119687]